MNMSNIKTVMAECNWALIKSRSSSNDKRCSDALNCSVPRKSATTHRTLSTRGGDRLCRSCFSFFTGQIHSINHFDVQWRNKLTSRPLLALQLVTLDTGLPINRSAGTADTPGGDVHGTTSITRRLLRHRLSCRVNTEASSRASRNPPE